MPTPKRLSFFERYLTLWVGLAGHAMEGRSLPVSKVSWGTLGEVLNAFKETLTSAGEPVATIDMTPAAFKEILDASRGTLAAAKAACGRLRVSLTAFRISLTASNRPLTTVNSELTTVNGPVDAVNAIQDASNETLSVVNGTPKAPKEAPLASNVTLDGRRWRYGRR